MRVQDPSPSQSSDVVYTITNNERSTWMFQFGDRVVTYDDGSSAVEEDSRIMMVGESAMTDALLQSIGATRSVRSPSPVVQITASEFSELRPADQRMIAALVARGRFTCTPPLPASAAPPPARRAVSVKAAQ